jgi:hypothetical protein
MADDFSQIPGFGEISLQRPEPTQLLMVSDAKSQLVVSIGMDGKVTFGEGMTPDDAAKAFWEAVASKRPMCAKCGANLFP